MSRILEIKRREGVIGCRAYYRVYINDKVVGKIANGQVFRCEIPSYKGCILQIKEAFSLRGTGSDRITIKEGDENVSFYLTPHYNYLGGTQFTLARRAFGKGIGVSADDVTFEKSGLSYTYDDKKYRLKFSKACKLWRLYHYGETKSKEKYACDKKTAEEGYEYWFYDDPILKINTDLAGAKYFEKSLFEHGVRINEVT